MDASEEGVDSVSPSASPSQSGRIGSSTSVSGSGGRTRSTRRKYVAESESLTAISQDAEDKLTAKRKDRQERRGLRLKELQRKQQIEDAKENLVNGDAADSKDIPSVRVNDRVAVSVAPSTNAVPSLSTPSSPRSASPLVNGEAIGRGAGSRDPTSAPHLLEPRANSLPRNVKGLNNRRESGGGDGGSSADEEARSVSLAQYRDVKKALADCEEKVKSLLMRNQHLDNEKASLNYAVDLLQDQFEELSERTVETDRLLKVKSHQLEAARRDNKHLQSNVAVLRQQLQQREDLVQQHGLVLVGGEVIEKKVGVKGVAVEGGDRGGTNDADDEVVVKRRLAPAAIIQRHTAALLDKDSGSEGTLDFRLRRFAAEKEEMRETIRVLQGELEAAMNADPANVSNSSGFNRSSVVTAMDELQTMTREERKKLDECKLKLEKTEMELMTADSAILRLEQQVKRYKEMLDTSEKTEEDLKTERRKITRELRDANGQVEELTNANKHLQTRLDKIRAVRGVLQTELNKPV